MTNQNYKGVSTEKTTTKTKTAQPKSCELCFTENYRPGDSLSYSSEAKEEPGYIGVFAGEKQTNRKQ